MSERLNCITLIEQASRQTVPRLTRHTKSLACLLSSNVEQIVFILFIFIAPKGCLSDSTFLARKSAHIQAARTQRLGAFDKNHLFI